MPARQSIPKGAIHTGRNKKACMGDEPAAQEMMAKIGCSIPVLRRRTTTQGGSSYVELISCLDITRNAEAIQEPKRAPPNKTMRGRSKR
jgi:hypothetical protein